MISTGSQIWDLVGGNQIGKNMEHSSTINSVVFSPDGKTILTASDDIARLWDLQGNRIGKDMKHFVSLEKIKVNTVGYRSTTNDSEAFNIIVNAVAFSPDGRIVLTGGDDKAARLWDLHGNQIAIAMKHSGPVYNVAFTSNGATILTNSDYSGIRLWRNVVTLDNFLKSDHLAPLEKLLLTDQQKKKYGVK